MKNPFEIIFILFAFSGILHAKTGTTELFAGEDYCFSISTPDAGDRIDGNGIRVEISTATPLSTRYIIFLSRSRDYLQTTFASITFEPPKHQDSTEAIEIKREDWSEHVVMTLWKGVGGNSPSGIMCDQAIVTLPLEITRIRSNK